MSLVSSTSTWMCFDSSNQCKFNQHLSALLISLSGFAIGVTLAWNSSTSDTLRNVFNATGIEMGLVGSIVNVGACGGVLILPCVLKSLRRTTVMVSTTPIYLVGWAFICLADRKMWCLGIGRLLCGFSNGISCVLSPILITEIADKKTRVKLLTYFQLFINCGIFYAFLVKYLIDEKNTIWKYSLISAISCIPIVFISILPESPLYYLMKNDESNAEKSIKWYHDTEKYQEELLNIKNFIKSILTCHGVIIIQQLSGINPLTFNAAIIFDNCGSGDLTSGQLTVIIAAIQIISSLMCTIFIDRLGRRILLTLSGISMGIFLILLGWYFSVRDNDPEFYEEIYGWMPPTWFALFFASFNLGLGPISWSILGDTLPNEIKTLNIVTATFISWFISFIMTLIFGKFIITLGVSYGMWIFAGVSIIGAIFFAIFIRETSNKSLIDIQNNFKMNQLEIGIH
ncbi:hypothetical protein PV325_003573 [Microctonus aethiopoides]|nr:hypothetical protein PV325_003573 [Microctonus aethiopoides]